MRFLVISPVIHKQNGNGFGGYTPYVREMNLWLRHVDEVMVIAPFSVNKMDALDAIYQHPKLTFVKVPEIDTTSVLKAVKSTLMIPVILFKIFKGMQWATHIHLRCPSNLGLLSSFLQMFFPQVEKTVKYANNWDWKSKQPISYRLQQSLLRNEFFTKKAKVLVYGDWHEKSKNIIPFYTASYSKDMRTPIFVREINKTETIKLLFVGTITPNKRPFLCIEVLEELIRRGLKAELTLLGGGAEFEDVQWYINENNLQNCVHLMGKVHPDQVIKHFKASHFLVFLSMSEGWPKVVAESMWWGCLPVTTNVSCVKQMVGDGQRGVIVEPELLAVSDEIEALVNNPEKYKKLCVDAMEWSREYHLERFEEDVVKLIETDS